VPGRERGMARMSRKEEEETTTGNEMKVVGRWLEVQ